MSSVSVVSIPSYSGLLPYGTRVTRRPSSVSLNPFLFRSPSIRIFIVVGTPPQCLNPFLFRSPSILEKHKHSVDRMVSIPSYSGLLPYMPQSNRCRRCSLNPFLFRSPSIPPQARLTVAARGSQSLLIQVSFHTSWPCPTTIGRRRLNPFLFRSPSIPKTLPNISGASRLNPFLFRSPSIPYAE